MQANDQTQKEPEVTDNVEEFGVKIPSAEEQQKIMAEIIQEESFKMVDRTLEDDAVFLEDEAQPALDKLLNIKQAPLKERLAYTKHLAELIQMMGQLGLNNIGSIIQAIITDSDEIKRLLIQQIGIIADQFHKQGQFDQVKGQLISTLMTLLRQRNFDVQAEASHQLSRLAANLTDKERGELILNDVIILGHDEQLEENKMVALQLYGAIAKAVGRQYVENFLVPEIINACDDSRQRVKKEAVQQIAQISQEVSNQCFAEKCLPLFLEKSTEKIWQVRKVCAQTIVSMAKLCNNQQKEKIIQTMLALLKDNQKWVKGEAYLQLGQFITAISPSRNDQLIIEFCRISSKDIHEYYNAENDILEPSASQILDVIKASGKDKWPQLSKLLQYLLKLNNKQIRGVLALVLPEIAIYLGPEIAGKELISVLDSFLKDSDDKVRYAATQGLWKFISVFDMDTKDNLLDVFLIIQKDQKKWRMRQLIARQLNELVNLYSPEIIFQIIVPISLKLCNDIVALVRKQAAKQMNFLLQALRTEEPFYHCLIENIKAFALSNRFNQRQAYTYMCSNLLNSTDFHQFAELLEILSRDPVRNVRISVAKVIVKHLRKNGLHANDSAIKRILENLKQDPLKEIQIILQ